MRHALSTALQEFEGAMVLVSHDRHLLQLTCDSLLLVDAGQVAPFAGDLEAYPAWISQRAAERRRSDNAERIPQQHADSAAESAASKKIQRQREAAQRARTQPLRRRLAQLEQRLEQLSAEQETLDQRLSHAQLYEPEAKSELLAAMEHKRQLAKELAAVEQAWLTTGEELEQLQAQQP
jgi:ATP-binding cassette subfamily F protein 3